MEQEFSTLREKIAADKVARNARYAEFEAAFDEARKAGYEAGVNAIPRPMVVTEHSNPLDDASPAARQWYVSEGPCGFAWVRIRPANSSFAKWLVKQGYARKAYGGGLDIWISEHNQSVTRKEAHAAAMAKVLTDRLGVMAYADSRLD